MQTRAPSTWLEKPSLVAGPYVSAGLERAGELLEEAIDAAAPYVSAGLERAGELLTRVPDHLSADR